MCLFGSSVLKSNGNFPAFVTSKYHFCSSNTHVINLDRFCLFSYIPLWLLLVLCFGEYKLIGLQDIKIPT